MPTNIPTTNGTFYNLTQNDNELREVYLNLWFSPKRAAFYKQNEIRIQSLFQKRNNLMAKYFVIENENIIYEGEGENRFAKLKEGMRREDYEKEYTEFAATENIIKL